MSKTAASRKRKAKGSPRPALLVDDKAHTTTIETMLSVPLEVIFRQTGANRKPLLTRAEARCLLRITMLAQEIDVLVRISNDALDQRRSCCHFGMKLTRDNNNKTHPFLRPLLPLLSLQGRRVTTHTIEKSKSEMRRVLTDLQHCGQSLRQFSEHNWTLSESLLDALGGEEEAKGAVLAMEKRRLSDLEEELCNRIDTLVSETSSSQASKEDEEEEESQTAEGRQEGKSNSSGDKFDSYTRVSMADVCFQLWNPSGKNDEENPEHQHTAKQAKSQESENRFSYPTPLKGSEQPAHYRTAQSTVGALDDVREPPQNSDDETVMNEDEEDAIMQDAQNSAGTKRKSTSDNSQQSTHSIVSNHSDEDQQAQEPPPKKKKKKKKNQREGGDDEEYVRRLPTQSQVDGVEGLAMLAGGF